MTSCRLAAKAFDEINLVLVSALLALASFSFYKYDPVRDFWNAGAKLSEDANTSTTMVKWVQVFEATSEYGSGSQIVYFFLACSSLGYTIFNSLYIVKWPECSAMPISQLLQNFLKIVFLVAALNLGMHCAVPFALIVDVNSFLLLVIYLHYAPEDRNASTFSLAVSGAAKQFYNLFGIFIELFFLATWLVLRLIYMPCIVLVSHRMLHPLKTGLHYYVIVGSLTGLSLLNYWWSSYHFENIPLAVLACHVALALSFYP